jgi:hypothetical protein
MIYQNRALPSDEFHGHFVCERAFLKALHYQSWRLKFSIAVIRGTKNQRQENFSYVLGAQHNNSMSDESKP